MEGQGMGVGGIGGIVGGAVIIGAIAGGAASGGSSGGSGGGSSGGASDSPSASAQTTISGIFALGGGVSSTSRAVVRQVANATVEIFDKAGSRVAVGQTNANGSYTFQQEITSSRYPLRIVSRLGGIEYSSVVISTEKAVTAHVNEMTTVVARQFQANAKSAAAFKNIQRSVMAKYFGINNSGNLNIPQDLFFSRDFSNALLETAHQTGISLLVADSPENPLFQNRTFLTNFVATLKSKADSSIAIDQLSTQTGSVTLTTAITTLVNTLPNSSDAETAIAGLLSTTTTTTSTTTTTTLPPGTPRFVAVGEDGKASYSTDGISWIRANHNNGDMYAVAYRNGRFVAVGYSGSASYSTDGISWTASNHDNGYMDAIAYGNGRFVAVGVNGVASYSTDGISWTTSNRRNGTMRGIAFSD